VSSGSVRTRILSGAFLWTVGLFVGAVVLSTLLMLRYRQYPVILHGTASSHAAVLVVFVVICLVAGFVQVRRGLRPLDRLRERLGDVRSGRERRIVGRYPAEVQPLVEDLNQLLDHRDQAVRRAIAKAGDLAHGLKTPLAVLAHEADRVRRGGDAEVADTLTALVEKMRRQVEYHLVQARAAASGAAPGAQCRILDSAEGLERTLRRLHAERGITITVDIDAAHVVRVQREDLDEMLGNLLDNACNWTRTRVTMRSRIIDTDIVIDIDDDGPGVPAGMHDVVLQRGVRADQAAAGTGFGLAIVSDLAELYGGAISLESAPGGGLRARLRLPAVA
jgi:signal transduction histidine kinase